MGVYWSWNEIQKDNLTDKSLYNHPDVGCEFSEGKPCVECPFQECWEIIGRWKFRRDNKIKEALT